MTETWFEGAVGQMIEGLKQADRFAPERRRNPLRPRLRAARVPLAPLFSTGWQTPRKVCLEELTDAWYHTLVVG